MVSRSHIYNTGEPAISMLPSNLGLVHASLVLYVLAELAVKKSNCYKE